MATYVNEKFVTSETSFSPIISLTCGINKATGCLKTEEEKIEVKKVEEINFFITDKNVNIFLTWLNCPRFVGV